MAWGIPPPSTIHKGAGFHFFLYIVNIWSKLLEKGSNIIRLQLFSPLLLLWIIDSLGCNRRTVLLKFFGNCELCGRTKIPFWPTIHTGKGFFVQNLALHNCIASKCSETRYDTIHITESGRYTLGYMCMRYFHSVVP